MKTRLALALALLALPIAGTIVRAQEPPAAAAAAARSSGETAEGKKFADTVGEAFGREQAGAIQRCARETRRPDLSDFQLVLRIERVDSNGPNSANGVVREAFNQPATALARCLAASLPGWKVAPPPVGHEWVSIAVRLKPR
jgi:hypothetical protein